MNEDGPDTARRLGRRVAFDGGVQTVLVLGGVFAVLGVLAVLIENATATLSYPAWVGPVAGLGKFGLLAGLGLALLRVEGVGPTELGLAPRLLKPALVVVAGLWVSLNVLAVGLATAAGTEWGLQVLVDTPIRWHGVPLPRVTTLLFGFLVVALVEEFVFRGYLQTKMIALLGDGSLLRVGLGIAAAGLIFGAMHAPGAIVAGASPGGVLGTVLFISASGVAFGVLYELTHNLYLVALLHGIGNSWPLVGDIWAHSGATFAASLAGVLAIYVSATVAYRYFVVDRRDAASGHRQSART